MSFEYVQQRKLGGLPRHNTLAHGWLIQGQDTRPTLGPSASLSEGSAGATGPQSSCHRGLHTPPLGSSLPSRGRSAFFTFPGATLGSSKKPKPVSVSLLFGSKEPHLIKQLTEMGRQAAEAQDLITEPTWRTLQEVPPSPISIFQETGAPEPAVTKQRSKCHPDSPRDHAHRGEELQDPEKLRPRPLPPPAPG